MEIAGRRFGWREIGEGPRLLLVQGYAGTVDAWNPGFLAALKPSFELVMPDNRGMGASDLGDPGSVTIDSMASDLVALIDELGIERIPVAGFSMGGFIAQALARQAPERIEALTLISTDPGGPGAVRADPADWGRLVDRSGTPRERASRTLSVLFPPEVARVFDREVGDLVAVALAALDPVALEAHERAMGAWWASPQPSAAGGAGDEGSGPPFPVAIGHGVEDLVIPAGNAELLAERFAGARLEHFAKGGHAFMAQEPEATAELIRSAQGTVA